MNFQTMRFLDQYLGFVICVFLKLFSPFRQLFCRDSKTNHKKILVIKFFGMGTILLAHPALRKIKEKYHNSEIIMLTIPQNREICQMVGSIDRVICMEITNILAFPLGLIKLFVSVWKAKCDILIDLEFFANFTAIITFFSLVQNTVGFSTGKGLRDTFYNKLVSFDHSRNIRYIFLKLSRAVAGQIDNEFSFSEERKSLLRETADVDVKKLLGLSNDGEFLVCININSSGLCLSRRWPMMYYKEVIEYLFRYKNCKVILIGGPDDISYVEKLERQLPLGHNLINICGKTNISQLIAILNRCKLFITNDSGPLHIAEALSTPTISFFGPETPYLYGPQGSNHHVFYSDLYCSPCLNIYNSKESNCKNNMCLKSIKPDEVIKVIESKYLTKIKDEKTAIKI